LCAQNRKKLLGKLEQLGITEEEYLAKKRKQKSQYERERVKSKKEREKSYYETERRKSKKEKEREKSLDAHTSEEILRINNHFRK